MSFDDMPRFKPPNPLPCGCGLVGIDGINVAGTHTEFRNIEIRFCPLHSSAAELLEALERLLGPYHQNDEPFARAVIAKAKGNA